MVGVHNFNKIKEGRYQKDLRRLINENSSSNDELSKMLDFEDVTNCVLKASQNDG